MAQVTDMYSQYNTYARSTRSRSMSTSGSSSSGKKPKAAGIVWHQTEINYITATVESVKGDQSPFIVDQKKALQDLTEELADSFDDQPVILTYQRVRDKLNHIWTKCKINKDDRIEEFWRFGTDKLDMGKFNNQFLPEHGWRPFGSGKEEGEEEDGEEEDGEEDGGNDAADTDAIPTNDSGPVPAVGPANPRVAGVKRSRQESSDIDTEEQLQKARRLVDAKPDLRLLSSKSRWDATKGLPRPTDIESVEGAINALQTTVVRQTGAFTPLEAEVDCKILHHQIMGMMRSILPKMGFPVHQPPALDIDICFSPEMQALLAILMGSSGQHWGYTERLLKCALSLQTADQLSLNVFLQGLLGAALTSWVLEVDIFERYSTFTDEWLHVQLPAEAKRLAEKFDVQVSQVMPNRRGSAFLADPEKGLMGPEYRKAEEPVVKQQSSFHKPKSQSVSAEPLKSVITLGCQVEWIKSLTQVFHLALQFRANLAMHKDFSDFEFEMPSYMDPTGEPEPNRVLLGLLPTIKVREGNKDKGAEAVMTLGGDDNDDQGELKRLVDGIYHSGFIKGSETPSGGL